MCGLVGLAGNIGFKEEKVFKTMLMLDVLRGKHSTGVASMHVNAGKMAFGVVKDSVNAVEFVDTQPFTSLMAKKHYALLGHNRYATRGAIIPENSHPFEFEHLIGAHNGSLVSQYQLHNQAQYAVDSQALYSEFNENGAAEGWGKVNGAAALTWIDKRDNSVNFLRNKDRPLFFTFLNKGETIIWASEPWMIHVACGREDVKIDSNPREVAINTIYKFNIQNKVGHKIDFTREEVKAYIPKSYSGWGTYSTRSYNDNDYLIRQEEAVKKLLESEGVKEGQEVEFTVEKINDYNSTDIRGHSAPRADICGKTMKGNDIRIYSVDTIEHEDLIMDMWEVEGAVFRATVKCGSTVGLILNIGTCESTGYTLDDLGDDALAALDSLAEEEKKKEEEIKKPSEEQSSTLKLTKSRWKISCSYCRTMSNEYYIEKSKLICCVKCHDAFDKAEKKSA